jgi:hypothetical protein
MNFSIEFFRTRPSDEAHCTKVSAISAFSSPARSRKKEHEEFALNMNLVDVLPPGLFEMVLWEEQPHATS